MASPQPANLIAQIQTALPFLDRRSAERMASLRPEIIPYVAYSVWVFHQLYPADWISITSGTRTRAEQIALQGQYPVVADPGDSAHEYGFGWDSDVPDNRMAAWIQIRRAIGWELAKDTRKDPWHSGWPGWRSLVGLRAS